MIESTLKNKYFYLFYFYKKDRYKERGRYREVDLAFSGSLSKWPQQPGLSWSETRRQELLPGIPHERWLWAILSGREHFGMWSTNSKTVALMGSQHIQGQDLTPEPLLQNLNYILNEHCIGANSMAQQAKPPSSSTGPPGSIPVWSTGYSLGKQQSMGQAQGNL